MRRFLLLLSVLLSVMPMSYGQQNRQIHHIRLGNLKTTLTTYDQYSTQTATTTYDEVLTNPKLVCDMPDCKVTQFIFSILTKGMDIYGPYSSAGDSITNAGIAQLMKLKEAGAGIKIVFEDIRITCGGKTGMVKGALFYKCN